MLSGLIGFKHVKLETVSMWHLQSAADPELGNRGEHEGMGWENFKQK